VTPTERPAVTDGLQRHCSRLRGKQDVRQERIRALSGHMANISRAWLLVLVEDGSPRSFRQVKMLADGETIQL
jgi:hypothetical protein